MATSIRAKLWLIVAGAGLSFAALIAASAATAGRVDRQMSAIEATYLPKIELRPRLEGRFEGLQRAFQDAVAAHDAEALERTEGVRRSFEADLAGARGLVDPADAAALSAAFQDYYAAARGVARRMLADEAGEGIVEAAAAMQQKQARAAERLTRATAFDRGELSSAFADVRKAQASASRIRLVVSVACLAFVLALSAWLSRGVIRTVGALGEGFERFGRGDFGTPIGVVGGDELAAVAGEANRMAESLDRLDGELRAKNLDLEGLVTQLGERKRQLEETNRELDSFAYSVSHDLRAPLRAIDGFARVLIEDYDQVLDDEGKRVIEIICKNTQKMGRLIDDLLSFSRLGRQPVVSSPVDMEALARGVLDEVVGAEPGRSIEARVGPLPKCQGDPSLLRQLWVNLLSNAVKYTRPRATAHIEVRAEASDDEWVYTVKDDGVGFDARYADKLFGVFQRLHTASEFEGTGVGLAIVHRVARRHGGWVRAESALGEGSTFTFAIPRKKDGPDGP